MGQRQWESKVNLSQSVRNDIERSEKTLQKRASHTGRDDRATTEQVSRRIMMMIMMIMMMM